MKEYRVTLNRLIAIFSSLNSFISRIKTNPYSIEFAADLGSLFDLNFLKYVNSVDENTLNRKITVLIQIDFAIALAANLDISLTDFVDLSIYDTLR